MVTESGAKRLVSAPRAEPWRYGIAVAAVLAAWLLVELVWPLQQRPYMTFLAAIMVGSWTGGLGPGIVATLASCLLIERAVLAPLVSWAEAVHLGSFTAIAMIITYLNERRLRATASEVREREQFRASLRTAARDLEHERARFEAVLQQMPGGVAIVDAPSGNFVLQNQRAEDIIGVPLAGSLSKSMEDLAAKFRHVPPLALWPVARALRAGEVVHNEDLDLVRANGDRLVVRASAAPIRDTTGTMIAAVATFEDVTDLKAAEESLRFLQETSTTLAASLDFDTTLQSVVQLAVPRLADWCLLHTVDGDEAPARLTAAHVVVEKARLLEMLYADYPVPPDARHGYAYVMRTGETELVPDVPPNWAAQARDDRHAGYLRQLEMRSLICLPLRVAGRIVGALTLATGESGRRYGTADCRLAEHFGRRVATAVDNARLYREIAEADRRKSEFLALLAHELRNPLAPMRNAVEILRLTDDDATSAQMRTLLERQLGQMARLIDDLVDLSRVERNKIALRLESVDVTVVVRRAIDVHRSAIATRAQTLVESLPSEPMLVRADAARLEQIVSNLLDNAAKYTDARGTIEVGVEGLRDAVRVTVRDSGRGIGSDFLPHVFDSFRRGGQPGAEGSSGLGIGLTLVKRLVELHGGTVTARSAGVAQGSEFVVTLPLHAAATDTIGTTPTAEPAPTPRRLRALVCDDNARAADTLGTLLELWGYDVDVVYDGESAISAVNAQWPDVALLDLALPGIDGYEVAVRLRRQPTVPRLFIVAISGHGQDGDRQRSLAAGFDHHMVKPIDPPALRTLLRDHAQEAVESSSASAPL